MIYQQLGALVAFVVQRDFDAAERVAKNIRLTMDASGAPIPKALAMEASVKSVRPEEAAIRLLTEINLCRDARLPQELWNRLDEYLAKLPPQFMNKETQ